MTYRGYAATMQYHTQTHEDAATRTWDDGAATRAMHSAAMSDEDAAMMAGDEGAVTGDSAITATVQ